MATTGTRPLNQCPTNVKEALEWLEALESGAQGCANVITQQILGNQNGNLNGVCQQVCREAKAFMTAIKNGGGTYPSTYQRNGWNQLCQTGGRCCAGTNGYGRACSQCHGGSSCQGCCKNCPQQICARIFCLIVPVVESALQCLQFMVQYHNGRGHGNTEQYLRALGFNSEGVQQVLQVRQSSRQPQPQPPNGSLGTLLGALHSATQEIKNALQGSQHSLFDGQSTGGLSTSYSTPALTTPTSAKDLMLWTIFLPYCSNYGSVQMMLRGSLLSTNGDTSPRAQNGQTYSPLSPFDNLLYGLHVLFIGMDGGGQGLSSPPLPQSSQTIPLRPPSTLFDGINMVCQGLAPYEYYTSTTRVGSSYTADPTQCLKLLIAGIPIISWAVEMLHGKYNGTGSNYYNGYNLQQHLGFSGDGQRLLSTLGQQIIHYIHLALEPIKTAYCSDKLDVNSSSHSGTYPSATPTTFREMLLWLQGLPCSQGYTDIRTLLTNGSGSKGPTTVQTSDPLVEIIFNLPYLFYSLESDNSAGHGTPGAQQNGAMTRYITELFERQGIQVRSGATGPKPSTPSPATAFSYDTTTIQKTFCAIVAVVYYVVDHLKRKYNGEGSSHSIGFGTDSGLLEFLGWNRDQRSGLVASYNGSDLKDVLQHCLNTVFGATQGRGASGGNGDPLSRLFQQLRGKLSATSALSTSSSAPTTFRDTLLWLVGAPLTQGYETKKGDWNKAVRSVASSHSATDIESNITDTIVGVLQLFHKLEGNILSAVLGVFGNGGTSGVSLKYRYGVTGSNSGSTTNNNLGHSLFGATVVMRSVFGFLQQRCDRLGASRAVTPGDSSSNYSWHSCSVTCTSNSKPAGSTTPCDANNPLCKFLCLLGWDHKTRGSAAAAAKPGAPSTPLNGSKFHTLLSKWFGDVTAEGTAVSASYPVTSSSNEPVLEKLYDCAVQWFQGKTGSGANKGTDSSGTTATTPTTIREMMLWLIGLPLHSVYKALTKNGSKENNGVIENKLKSLNSRTDGATDTYSFSTTQLSEASQITNAIVSSSQGMIITMLAIEGSIKSVWDFLTKGLKKDNQSFNYGSGSGSSSKTSDSDPDACFSLLVDYTYKVHFQLRFLLTMCNTKKADGGWKDCEYSGSGTASGLSSSSSSGSSLECKCNGSSSSSCPMPLYNFLCGGVKQFKNTLNGNGTGGAQQNGDGNDVKMGFLNGANGITHITTPSTTNKLTGADIYALLKYFVDTATGYTSNIATTATQPLSLLAQCIVAIGERGPQSLGDCFELVRQLGYGELRSYVDRELKKELQDITLEVKDEKKNNGAVTALITAIQNLFSNQHTGSNHNDKKDLRSLMCSNAGSSTNSCAPYMKSLSQGMYHYYCPEIDESDPEKNQFTILQYIYDMLKKLVDKMKELKKAFDECPCCKSPGQSCDGLIQCPNAHPILYKFGFVFGDPSKLTGKKCQDIKAQLGVVLSCTKNSESTLFSAFECVIQVTYSILLQKAKGKVNGIYNTSTNGDTPASGLKSTNQEMNTAFTLYVTNAMYDSYPKLICTFACKVFDSGHDCSNSDCKKRFTAPGPAPTTIIADLSTSTTLQVTKSAVTTITAVIPQYTAPVIDRYHYKAFKKSTTPGSNDKSTHYSFRDALDFHIKGAQCIRPTPVALRSVIDWILRVTVGAIATQKGKENGKKNNDNISKLSEKVVEVFQKSGMTGSDVNNNNIQSHLTDLVFGLRKFVGYKDKSQSVKTNVTTVLGTNGNNGVKGALKEKIKSIDDYLKNSAQFGTELGKALLKGQYAFKETDALETLVDMAATLVDTLLGIDNKKNIHVRKNFKDAVKTFSDILISQHSHCTATYCKDFNKDSNSTSSSNGPNAEGLSQLHTFFTDLQKFAALWDSIGNKNGILQQQKGLAATEVSKNCNGSSSANGEYFNKLHQALTELGKCADKVQALENTNGDNGSVTDSKQYRTKITALITGLNAFGTHIAGCNFNGSENSNNGSDPQYAVKGAEALIKKTVSNVEAEITKKLKETAELSYTLYVTDEHILKIGMLLFAVNKHITEKLDRYKSHLDDLKQLCQWLYRMGQLYAHGLKGFVESLVKHLEHIIQVIKWIEKLAEHLKWLNDKTGNFDSEDRRGIVGLCKVGIENLLHGTYVLNELPDGNGQKEQDKTAIATRIKFLSDLRLIALDRYTLQVWQDECKPNGGRQSAIKDWITFENGIITHSDLEEIKSKLSELTGIVFDSNTASSTPAYSLTNRIQNFHAICVIQKFSYEAPIAKLERSLKELLKIQGQLSAVKGKCNEKTDLSSDDTVTSFCTTVTEFLKDPYGIFSFAKFVHTIMGPNIFSAVIGAFEELKDKEKYKPKTQNGGNLDKIKGILGVMTEGLQSDAKNNTKDDHYKLENICEKLEAFISTLKKEYIFCYPVVTATATHAIAPAPPNPQPKTPTCPNRDHSMSSICQHCHPFLAKIFIGAIPNLYRHCRLLYEMCDIEPGYSQKGILSMTAEDYYNRFMLSLSVFMSHQGYEVLTRGKDGTINPSAFKYELDPMLPVGYVFQKLKDIISGSDPLDETKTDSLMPLDQLFKAVMQHFKDERNKKRKQREEKLKQEFDKNPNNRGLPFQAPPPVLPSTVRQVLFWLHELDTQGEFYKQLCDHIFTLCKQSSIQIYDGVITHLLKLSATQCLEVLATIEDPGRQNADYYYELYTEEHYYAYPTVNIPLFFYTFVEKLMAAFLELNFVCVQCEFLGSQGGWHGCRFYSDDKVFSRDPKGTHCTCSALESTCPRPLSAFLFSDQKNQLRIPSDVSQRLAYMSKGTMPCGFKLKNKAITDAATPSPAHTPTSTSVSGSVLVEPLRKLVGGHVTGRLNDTSTRIDENNTLSTVIYLRDLLRYTLCLAVRPPWSMSENMAFFYRLTESWKKDQVYTGVRVALRNDNLLGAIHAEIDMFPGSFEGKKLTLAVERFAGVADKEHQKTNGTVSNTSHQFDLKTLMGCQETNTATSSGTTPVLCSPFMFPLSLDVYTHYDERNSRAYLSWILNFAFGIYGQLRGLQERMEQQTCVTSNASKGTSQCPSLPMCPGVLTALYQSGSSFMDQGQLAKNTNAVSATTTKKTCDDFHSVLTGLFNCEPSSCSPLHNLIVQCEAFLWSIRLPFSLVQLSLWSVAILFISYVFVVPLDHFKIKSHLFNRLKYTMHPSLLIADQQRRVSEVAYFSL